MRPCRWHKSLAVYYKISTPILCMVIEFVMLSKFTLPWKALWLPLSCQLHWSGAVPQLWPEGPLEGGPKRQDRHTTLPHTWSTTGTRTKRHKNLQNTVWAFRPEYKRINTVHPIMVPHLKLFSICSVTGHPRSSANICHAPGLAEACPQYAMHLPSCSRGM